MGWGQNGRGCGNFEAVYRMSAPSEDRLDTALTYADEYRIAKYLVTKLGNRSPSWLARTMGVQYAQAARWLEAIDRSDDT